MHFAVALHIFYAYASVSLKQLKLPECSGRYEQQTKNTKQAQHLRMGTAWVPRVISKALQNGFVGVAAIASALGHLTLAS